MAFSPATGQAGTGLSYGEILMISLRTIGDGSKGMHSSLCRCCCPKSNALCLWQHRITPMAALQLATAPNVTKNVHMPPIQARGLRAVPVGSVEAEPLGRPQGLRVSGRPLASGSAGSGRWFPPWYGQHHSDSRCAHSPYYAFSASRPCRSARREWTEPDTETITPAGGTSHPMIPSDAVACPTTECEATSLTVYRDVKVGVPLLHLA